MSYAAMLQRHYNEKKALLDEEHLLRGQLADRHLQERGKLDPRHDKIQYHELVIVHVSEIKEFYQASKLRYVEMQRRQDDEMSALFR